MSKYLFFLLAIPLFAQPQAHIYVVNAPSGACIARAVPQIRLSTGVIYTCAGGTWAAQGGGGGGVCPSGSSGKVQKTDGTNCVASSITDDGSTVAIAEPLASPVLTTPTLPLGSLAGPPVASYNAGIQGEFSFAPTGMGVIDQESTFPNVLKVVKQSSTASSASAAISGRGYGVGATNLAYLGGVEGETTYHGTGNPVLLFGSAGHVIVDAASTPGLATAFYADSASISNTTVPFVTSFYAKAPALGSGGAVTTFAPLYLFGRPLGADLNILTDLGTIQLVTPRATAGTTDSPVYFSRASSYDTVAHTVDWQTIDHPTSNAGASSFRIQNQVDGAGFVDKLAVDSAGNVTAASFTGTGSNPFINFPSNPTHTGAAGDLWNNAGVLQFGATPLNWLNTNGTPGAGILHVAGSTQTATSSAVSLTADVSGVLPTANIAVALANQTSIHGITAGTAAGNATLGQIIASGATALDFASTATGACATVIQATATGAVSTDVILFNANASIKAVTGYVPASTGGFSISTFPSADKVNFEACNWTAGTVDPGSITVNWVVIR